MEADIARLESRIDRLIAELQRLNSTVACFKEQQRPDWFARGCAAVLAIEVVFFVVLVATAPA